MISPPSLFWTESSNASVKVPLVTPLFLGFAYCPLMKYRRRATFGRSGTGTAAKASLTIVWASSRMRRGIGNNRATRYQR